MGLPSNAALAARHSVGRRLELGLHPASGSGSRLDAQRYCAEIGRSVARFPGGAKLDSLAYRTPSACDPLCADSPTSIPRDLAAYRRHDLCLPAGTQVTGHLVNVALSRRVACGRRRRQPLRDCARAQSRRQVQSHCRFLGRSCKPFPLMKLRSALAVLLISPRFGSRTGLKGSCLGHAMTTAWMARLPCGSRSLRHCMSVSLMGSSQARIFAAKVLAVEQCNEAASSRSEA